MVNDKLFEKIDDIVTQYDLLKHPFYAAWSEGTLTLDALKGYAEQYYKFVSEFPRMLSAVHSNCPDLTTRQSILENLAEEENLEKPHPELWINFGLALGLERDDITGSEMLLETSQALDVLNSICRNRSFKEGSAALYAYESRVPEIAARKVAGLESLYGVTGESGLEYFKLHIEVDPLHASIWKEVISGHTAEEEEDDLLDSVEESMKAYNKILDGVCRVYMN